MRFLLSVGIFTFLSFSLFGQIEVKFDKGVITYLSSQNVYVKFASTETINAGDSLYIAQAGKMAPSLLVSNKSSISCVCTPLGNSLPLSVGTEVVAKRIIKTDVVVKKQPEPVAEQPSEIPEASPPPPKVEEAEEEEALRQNISGRVSVASYSNLNNSSPTHRMRYGFSMRGKNIANSRFSAECYVTFRHTLGEWADVQDNLNSALKVYSLAGRYDFRKNMSLSFGRKINPKISSMGVIDGLQFEKGWNHFLVGVLAGSRPNFQDYSIDPSLLQVGAYIGHASANGNKYQQSTLAIVDQRNHLITDRRFLYFQHSNSLIKNLNAFSSFEVDLFQQVNNEARNTLSLTNFFVSLNYRVSKKMSISSSYDARKNTIYYESFKNYIDQLIEDETRQGLRLGLNLRPIKLLTFGVNASVRFQKSGENDSKNLNGYLTYSRIPWLNMSATLSANFLQTSYLNSYMYGLRISREIIKGKLDGEMYVRMVDYQYKKYEYATTQYIGGMGLNLRILRNLGLYLYYEGTMNDQKDLYHLINTKLIQRF
ncbi:MAG: hypothetical protein IPJ40_06665 [Saprospirales bacterium]|nr:hypothetical protein [Saprospirales bacterium]